MQPQLLFSSGWANRLALAETGCEAVSKKSPMRSKQKGTETLRSYAQKTYARFLKIRGRPRQIALGLALGLFVGMTPTLGIQTPIALFAASVLKWNKISAALGVWITNPLTAPFVYGLTYLVGKEALGIATSPQLSDEFSIGAFRAIVERTPEIFAALTAGGVILGLPVAVLGYYLSYPVLERYQERIKSKIRVQGKKITQKIKTRRKRQEQP
jgi:uncharacterized protein (DUF2062 family)